MKPVIQTSDGINGGKSIRYEIDLAKNGFQGELFVEALGYSRGSVEVFCSAGSGVSGTAVIKQRNRAGGKSFPLDPNKTIAFTEGEVTGVFGLNFTGAYLHIDTSNVVFGNTGTVEVNITLKL